MSVLLFPHYVPYVSVERYAGGETRPSRACSAEAAQAANIRVSRTTSSPTGAINPR